MGTVRQITDEIYQADIDFVRAKEYSGIGITHIVGMTKDDGNVSDIPYLRILKDDQEIVTMEETDQVIKFALECLLAGGKLLIHCTAGKNRSGSIIVLIRAIVEGREFDDVAAEMHDKFMKENPSHNWWPYEHLTIAYKDYLAQKYQYKQRIIS